MIVTATLKDIHAKPTILDEAIAARENLEITSDGKVTATLIPTVRLSQDEARRIMAERFANPDWQFSNEPMTRDERNSRG